MIVDNGCHRSVERQIATMDATRQINILGIHEEAFVEKPNFPKRVGAQKHEAALMVGNIEGPIVVNVAKFIPTAALGEPISGKESAHNKIERRRQPADSVLIRSVRVNDSRLQNADTIVRLHHLKQSIKSLRIKRNIGIDNEMIFYP